MASERSKDPSRDLKDSAQKIWLAGLGALAVAEEEGAKMFDSLVERGREWEGQGRERMDEARSRVKEAGARVKDTVGDVEDRIDDRVTAAMKRFGVPSRDEIHELTRRVEELNAKIEAMHGGGPGAAKGKAKG